MPRNPSSAGPYDRGVGRGRERDQRIDRLIVLQFLEHVRSRARGSPCAQGGEQRRPDHFAQLARQRLLRD